MKFDIQTHITSKIQINLKYQYNVPINIYKKYTFRHCLYRLISPLLGTGGRSPCFPGWCSLVIRGLVCVLVLRSTRSLQAQNVVDALHKSNDDRLPGDKVT